MSNLVSSLILGISSENAPLFGYGLFPDDMICIPKQDITKFEASSAAPRPGPDALQLTGWRGQNRYQPYERCEARGAPQTEHVQLWRQFARGQGRNRGRGSLDCEVLKIRNGQSNVSSQENQSVGLRTDCKFSQEKPVEVQTNCKVSHVTGQNRS